MSAADRPLIYFGRFFETSGYAAEARSYALGLARLGYRIHLLTLAGRFPCENLLDEAELGALHAMASTPVDSDHSVALLHQKPDTYPHLPCPVQIARTTFETDRIPDGWADRLNGLTEVWVPSRFNLETFAAAGVAPARLRLVRQGIDTGRFHPEAPPLALPRQAGFTFLSTFTWQNRKGWDILVRAFLTEFKRSDDVQLLLWAQPFYCRPEQMHEELDRLIRRELRLDPDQAAPVLLVSDPCSDRAMPGLYTACDAFVLPTRGEGWGRPLAEAMAAGLPTIGTAWGGNLDFMTPDNSYLVETDGLVPVDEGVEVASFRGHRWANPSVEHLRQVMRRVVEQPAEAAERGARARADMAACWDLRLILAELANELARFYD